MACKAAHRWFSFEWVWQGRRQYFLEHQGVLSENLVVKKPDALQASSSPSQASRSASKPSRNRNHCWGEASSSASPSLKLLAVTAQSLGLACVSMTGVVLMNDRAEIVIGLITSTGVSRCGGGTCLASAHGKMAERQSKCREARLLTKASLVCGLALRRGGFNRGQAFVVRHADRWVEHQPVGFAMGEVGGTQARHAASHPPFFKCAPNSSCRAFLPISRRIAWPALHRSAHVQGRRAGDSGLVTPPFVNRAKQGHAWVCMACRDILLACGLIPEKSGRQARRAAITDRRTRAR